MKLLDADGKNSLWISMCSPQNICVFASNGHRQTAGVMAESQTIPFIPLDIQEMILDQDEHEQNDEILRQMMLEQGASHTAQDGDQMRRWSL